MYDVRTFDELSLSLNDFVAQHPLFVVLKDEEIPPLDLVLLEECVGLHLDLLDLKLVDFAEKTENFTLLLCANALWKLLLDILEEKQIIFSFPYSIGIWYY